MAQDDLIYRVEEAQRRLNAWPDRDKDLINLLPTEGVCSLCYLAGKAEQPKHDLILLCPHPSALLVPYRWSDGRLRAGDRYMADKSAFVDMLKSLAEHYAGVNPAATASWMRLHGAAQELLAALQVLVLTPHILDHLEANDPMALEQARAAIAKASPQAP